MVIIKDKVCWVILIKVLNNNSYFRESNSQYLPISNTSCKKVVIKDKESRIPFIKVNDNNLYSKESN